MNPKKNSIKKVVLESLSENDKTKLLDRLVDISFTLFDINKHIAYEEYDKAQKNVQKAIKLNHSILKPLGIPYYKLW